MLMGDITKVEESSQTCKCLVFQVEVDACLTNKKDPQILLSENPRICLN